MPGRKIPRGKRKQRCRSSSLMRMTLKPRLALWAGVGVFVLAVALLASCGEDEYESGPRGNPNPNDPYPVWVLSAGIWSKYDQNGYNILTVIQEPPAMPLGLNNATGDIWAMTSYELCIFGPDGKLRKKTGVPRPKEPVVFDTRRKVAWACYSTAVYQYRLAKLDFDGNFIRDVAMPEGFTKYRWLGVCDDSGEVWLLYKLTLHKLDEEGRVIFSKTDADLNFEAGGFRRLIVDQTDGGVWLLGASAVHTMTYAIKVDRNGKRVRELPVEVVSVFDVNRRNGDVLAGAVTGGAKYGRLYNKSSALLWQSEPAKSFGRNCLNDFDGSAWLAHYRRPPVYELFKINADGEYVIRDVPTRRNRISVYKLYVKQDPYPY